VFLDFESGFFLAIVVLKVPVEYRQTRISGLHANHVTVAAGPVSHAIAPGVSVEGQTLLFGQSDDIVFAGVHELFELEFQGPELVEHVSVKVELLLFSALKSHTEVVEHSAGDSFLL
jgi:hypothetical protein